MEKIRDILMQRDGITFDEATELIVEAQMRIAEGEDPEDILMEEFGLEIDYALELMDF